MKLWFPKAMRFEQKILFALASMLLAASVTPAAESGGTFDHEHTLLTEALSEHVSDGLVDYVALMADSDKLNEYLQGLAEINSEAYKKWSRQQKLALWINAYNAFTIKVILDHYPIEHSWLADPLGQYPDNSIRQIRGVWDDMNWSVMGEKYSLNHMEHVIMRREFAETRVHFVLVCAAKGCPRLESKAFGASDLEASLDQAGIDYIYNSRRVRIDKRNKLVKLPHIFKWFSEDFESGTKYKGLFEDHPSKLAGILSWVYRYANDEDRKFLLHGSYETPYTYYDWALNE